MNIIQAQGFEVALRSFTANCVRLPGCPLGHGDGQRRDRPAAGAAEPGHTQAR